VALSSRSTMPRDRTISEPVCTVKRFVSFLAARAGTRCPRDPLLNGAMSAGVKRNGRNCDQPARPPQRRCAIDVASAPPMRNHEKSAMCKGVVW
jgi:hypothetical protein